MTFTLAAGSETIPSCAEISSLEVLGDTSLRLMLLCSREEVLVFEYLAHKLNGINILPHEHGDCGPQPLWIEYLSAFDLKKFKWYMSEQNEPTDNRRSRIDLDAFAWTYAQQTGELQHDGAHVATGYSGAAQGKNNPEMQSVPDVGPIPAGDWTISGPPIDTAEHGPYVLKLRPEKSTETFGRTGFLIHGDSKENPGAASKGCVILPRAVREEVWNSGDRELDVVRNISPGEVNDPPEPL